MPQFEDAAEPEDASESDAWSDEEETMAAAATLLRGLEPHEHAIASTQQALAALLAARQSQVGHPVVHLLTHDLPREITPARLNLEIARLQQRLRRYSEETAKAVRAGRKNLVTLALKKSPR